MSLLTRCLLPLFAVGAVSGCNNPAEIRMADPRTGVVAICRPAPANAPRPDTILAAVTQSDACVQELGYYGFQEEDALLAAAKPR